LRRPPDLLGVEWAPISKFASIYAEESSGCVCYSRAVVDNSRAVNEVLLARGKTSKEDYERFRCAEMRLGAPLTLPAQPSNSTSRNTAAERLPLFTYRSDYPFASVGSSPGTWSQIRTS
jgi:hypothetical protein